jgi:hypothetical protein
MHRRRVATALALVLFFALGATACHHAQDAPPADQAEDHDLPVTRDDIRILERADALLSSEAVWNRHDTRDCPAGETTFSLFCALHDACIDVLGRYDHRRAALQEVRFVIEERGKDYPHRLMGFNNDAATTFADLKAVLKSAEERVAKRLPRAR